MLTDPASERDEHETSPDRLKRSGWAVMLGAGRRRWGGDLRRGQIFRRLVERTDAMVIEGFTVRPLRQAFGPLSYIPLPLPSFRRGPKPRLASAEQLRPDVVRAVKRLTDPVAVAVYDDPIAQTEALGIHMTPVRERVFRARRRANLAAFRWHVVPSRSFAELVGLDMSRVIVLGNGTDTEHIRPGDWPEEPAIGMVSGAAPGRGIETLISAARLLREAKPQLRLLLWLVATGEGSAEYLAALRQSVISERWIEIGAVEYDDLQFALRQATVLCIPHPPGDYMDVALPVKLYDSMAAGRPLVVTPRTETRAVVERHAAGLVAGGDGIDDLAEALSTVLDDPPLAMRMGAAAREAAERHYDWEVVGDRLASTILEREGITSA